MKPLKTLIAATLLLMVSSAAALAADLLTLTRTIDLKGVTGKLDHIAIDSKGERLFVANKPNNTLDIIDLKTGTLVKQIPDQGKVSGVAYAADLDLIYVGNGAGTCNAFEGKSYQQVFSAKTPNADNVHYHSGNKMVYVGQDEILSELDAKTGEIKHSIALPGAVHGFRIDKKAGKIYAVLTKASMIAVIDLEKHAVVQQFPLTLSDAGSPIAQDAKRGLLFVGCPKAKPMVVIFDSNTGKEVGSVTIPAGVDDIYFDSKRERLYASCSDNSLVVIQRSGEEYKVVAKLPTPKDSRTCVWSKDKDSLYLGVPRQDGKDGPEVRIYAAEPLTETPVTSTQRD